MANVPLVADALALRVVGYHRFDDGFIDNLAPFEPIVGNYGNVANTDNMIDTPGSSATESGGNPKLSMAYRRVLTAWADELTGSAEVRVFGDAVSRAA